MFNLRIPVAGRWLLVASFVSFLLFARAGQAEWSSSFGRPAFSGSIHATVVHQGDLVLAGTFDGLGPIPLGNIARYDGSTWSDLGGGTDDSVFDVVEFQGELYAAGAFTSAGGVAASGIARWDGAVWSPVEGGVSGGVVRALHVHDSNLYVGGSFTQAGTVPASRIAVWDGSDWSSVGSGVDGTIWDIATFGTDVVLAGSFTEKVAVWNGASFQDLGSTLLVTPDCVLEYAGDLYIGADGGSSNSDPARNPVQRFDGNAWAPPGGGLFDYNAGFGPDLPDVMALHVFDGKLYAGGRFTENQAGTPTNFIAAWDGDAWTDVFGGIVGDNDDFGPFLGVEGFTDYLGNLVVVGLFPDGAGSVQAAHVVTMGDAGWQHTFFPGHGLDERCADLQFFEGELYAAGMFQDAGGVGIGGVARWDGQRWRPLGTGLDQHATSLVLYDDKLFAGGAFQQAGPYPVAGIAAWDGQDWSDAAPGFGLSVATLANYEGDLLGVGSDPPDFSMQLRRWNGSWTTLGVFQRAAYPTSAASFVAFDGMLIVGGLFDEVDGVPASNLASWDGATWAEYGGGTDGHVTSLIVHDGNLYAGGEFGQIGGQVIPSIARRDGTSWQPVGAGVDFYVYDLATYEGDLVACGRYGAANLARYDGATWESFGSGLGLVSSGFVGAEALEPVFGNLYVGGLFETAGGYSSLNIALWTDPEGTAADTPPVTGVLPITCYPNPFNPRTEIRFVLPRGGATTVEVLDARGRSVRRLWRGPREAGVHVLHWDGTDGRHRRVASGVYVVRVATDELAGYRRVTLLE